MIIKQNKTILILEDDVPVLNALSDKLKREGFETLQAENGEVGLELATKNHPDMILLDIIMPIMDGEEFLKKIRKSKETWGKKVPIMILTNLSEESKKKLEKYHPTFYFVKTSLSMNDVVEKIREQFNNK